MARAKQRPINTSGMVAVEMCIPHQKLIDYFWGEYARGNTKHSIADIAARFNCSENIAKSSINSIASLQWVVGTYTSCRGYNLRYRLADRVVANNWRKIGQCGDRIHPGADFRGLTVYQVPPGVSAAKVARSALPDEWKVL